MKSKIQKVSFVLKVMWDEYTTEAPEWYYKVKRYNKENNEENNEDIDPIVYLEETILDLIPEMKSELNKFADNAIEEIKVESIYEGSVVVLFTIAWNVAKTIKDVYDISKMVSEVSELFIRGKLKQKFRYKFDVRVNSLNITKKQRGDVDTYTPIFVETKRDTFFYYLLISNIIQAVIIGALVFSAVIKVYFAG